MDAKDKIMANVKADEATGCWVWTGNVRNDGYGRTKFRGKDWGAHRLSFTVFRYPVPDGLFVCHTCDRPLCVNPDHLFLGTALDNNGDAKRKGRSNNARPPE